MSATVYDYLLVISYWETRKVRWPLAIFYLGHNLHCHFKADFYRKKMKTLQRKGNSDANRRSR